MSSLPPDWHRFRRYGRGVWVVIPSLFGGFFTWVSFLILGVRARRRDWVVTATAYGVYSALAFFALGRPEVDEYAESDDVWNAGPAAQSTASSNSPDLWSTPPSQTTAWSAQPSGSWGGSDAWGTSAR